MMKLRGIMTTTFKLNLRYYSLRAVYSLVLLLLSCFLLTLKCTFVYKCMLYTLYSEDFVKTIMNCYVTVIIMIRVNYECKTLK